MSGFKTKKQRIIGRRKRVRSKIKGSVDRPRLSLFRSNRHLWAQVIDDESGKTLLVVSDMEVKSGKETSQRKILTPTALAEAAGKVLAKRAQDQKIDSIVFDRGAYKYHGLIEAFAKGAREGGLKF